MLCNPKYLHAGVLMMSLGNESPSQAVLNMYIMDTVVYNQKRSLPLQMQKKYTKEQSRIRKLNERQHWAPKNDERIEVSEKEGSSEKETGVDNVKWEMPDQLKLKLQRKWQKTK